MKAFESLEIVYYYTSDQNAGSQFDTYWLANMTEMEMMIETRPRYPANKLTFTIANLTKGTTIRFININFNFNAIFDVDVLLEDSNRNFLNSFCLSFF